MPSCCYAYLKLLWMYSIEDKWHFVMIYMYRDESVYSVFADFLSFIVTQYVTGLYTCSFSANYDWISEINL